MNLDTCCINIIAGLFYPTNLLLNAFRVMAEKRDKMVIFIYLKIYEIPQV